MMPPPPPPAADVAAAVASLPPLPADDYYEDDFEDDDDDMQLDDDDDLPSAAVVAAAAAAGGGGIPTSSPSTSSTDDDDHFRSPILAGTPAGAPPDGAEAKRPRAIASLEDSRRVFQRLWTDEDEIAILQGFHDFTSRRGTAHHAHQHDTGPFYEQIRSRLQLDFTKNQLVEKIRRLKKKYRNAAARMASGREFAFKSPHDRAAFEISRRIWGGAPPRDRGGGENGHGGGEQEQARRRRRRRMSVSLAELGVCPEAVAVEVKSVPALASLMPVDVKPVPVTPTGPVDVKPVVVLGNGAAGAKPGRVPNAVEETVKSCVAPLLKELLSCAMSGPSTLGMGGGSCMAIGSFLGGLLPGSPPLNEVKDGASEGKWRKQQISELEVYSKRLELMQEQIKVTLEELRSLE